MQADALPAKADVTCRQIQALRRKPRIRQHSFHRIRHHGCCQHGKGHVPNAAHRNRHQPGHFLQRHARFETTAGLVFALRQKNRAANGGVARKGNFRRGKENPHTRRMRRVHRLAHEYRLGKIELTRKSLHLRRAQTIRIHHNSQRIAAELLLGENVISHKFQLHAACSFIR